MFAHRHNSDGTVDSICTGCVRTIATEKRESGLQTHEDAHICPGFEPKPHIRATRAKAAHTVTTAPDKAALAAFAKKPVALERSVDCPFDKTRLAYLRAELARVRLEKIALALEIQTSSTPISHKLLARRRYGAADAEMRNIVRELEEFIAAAKRAQAASGTS